MKRHDDSGDYWDASPAEQARRDAFARQEAASWVERSLHRATPLQQAVADNVVGLLARHLPLPRPWVLGHVWLDDRHHLKRMSPDRLFGKPLYVGPMWVVEAVTAGHPGERMGYMARQETAGLAYLRVLRLIVDGTLSEWVPL